MIRPNHPSMSIVRQCRLVPISRSSFYNAASGENPENLALMAEIDRQFLDAPFYGARQMTRRLRAAGRRVSVERVRRLMRLMRLMSIYSKRRISVPARGTGTTRICCADLGSIGPTSCCARLSSMSRWPRASRGGPAW
ncbi:IS3 family transposase [Oceanibacterium hippocampi]|uniref:HTH-like domain-containing protein n=1 Tax=Oceanibacterium hippocampi TaxID=745714 RepID=A0A1Y5TZ98_9PROT|nr:IS3 family transposase [Oceanibacterium hippocampi]SLN72301.1 hypothetical protein OCH7691_03453 [Oceanibacterium hippocampi]